MSEGTLWERLSWWWTWRVWRPIRRRCAWCGLKLVPADDERSGDGHHDERDSYLGCGAWACYGCVQYGEG